VQLPASQQNPNWDQPPGTLATAGELDALLKVIIVIVIIIINININIII
jgi:hypothetical protein